MNAVATSAAIAILFPGVRSTDISNGAKEHGVDILIKEQYDPQKNYARYQKSLGTRCDGYGHQPDVRFLRRQQHAGNRQERYQ